MARVDAEGGFEMFPRDGEVADFEENIAQVDVAHGVAGMVLHGFRVGGARGGSISGGI